MKLVETLLGLNRAGRILQFAALILGVAGFTLWFTVLPGLRFSDRDEALFRAARHGDRAGLEQALAAGGRVNGASPVDGKTALFRAALLGHPDAVRFLVDHGADRAVHGNDGRSVVDVTLAAREVENDPAAAKALDAVLAILRERAQP